VKLEQTKREGFISNRNKILNKSPINYILHLVSTSFIFTSFGSYYYLYGISESIISLSHLFHSIISRLVTWLLHWCPSSYTRISHSFVHSYLVSYGMNEEWKDEWMTWETRDDTKGTNRTWKRVNHPRKRITFPYLHLLSPIFHGFSILLSVP